MPHEDYDVRSADIQLLSNRQGVQSFFVKLDYSVEHIEQTPAALGITNEPLLKQIKHIEQIASQENEFYVYLIELKSMRVSDRQALARSFRNLQGEFLLVLTSDYQSLDFVLLERIAPQSSGGPMAQKQVGVQQHVLTVDRQNPGPVALRVLRRFSYTEPDPFYQFDKLISAYTVAQWSEPLFNNRALFSDYYLNQRLRDSLEWHENPLPVYQSLNSVMIGVRERLTAKTEAVTRQELLENVFAILGFDWREGRQKGDGIDDPDYILLEQGNDQPLAYCLAYRWNRFLDGAVSEEQDPETPDENPGARVVSLLAQDNAPPYVIVTNGKVWRLYAAKAHSRSTNYYEIDLEETLASPERESAIRYFWLFFRAAAFINQETMVQGETRQTCFLDRLIDESANYAKELGERLKDRIFEEIFPHFAEGFITHMRQEGEVSPEQLDQVYQGTLTFLYRLMFLLYAEARDLLPVKEARGYHAISLQKLKVEIAEKVGNNLDAAPVKIRETYSPSTKDFYDRLAEVFRVIDQGGAALNIPRYNGGLFITDPDAGDTSPDAANARFLHDYKIPDRFLALGLDRLARDLDPKTHGLVMIDFKSLGVRQLGSIYEGLLEFKLRLASEKMAIVKGKRTEEIVPYKQAKKADILTTGRGANASERTLPKGTVYLENTRSERKATGSYYTPDYIVKYIVEHTVGPVMEVKFEALRPRLRQAEETYFKAQQNAKAKIKAKMQPSDPELTWNDEDMLQLAVDVLDVKVLDPAMGSGHFLVEVVDFVTDRTLTFLNQFRHNPVRAQLRIVRESILENMDEQGVNIDAGRLTDVNLLKRQVLKRSVYGVDLNHMAVELAKVSLWLDAFTLGAPLSFLDHHLRWGNSLIGTMARDADRELQQEQKSAGAAQMTLFGGPFRGLLQAAEVMRGVSALADATIAEAHQSADLFRQFEEAAKPYKQLLDVFVIRHFGVKRADEFLRLYGIDVMTAERAKVDKVYQTVLDEREQLYRDYRFFHWDLEFPEVFIDLDRADWKENGGFDAVVGNPPYDELSEEALGRIIVERPFLLKSKVYKPTQESEGRLNWYHYFMVIGLELLRDKGQNGFIVPMSWMGDSFTLGVRKWMLSQHTPTVIEVFPQKDDPNNRVFFDAKLPTSIFIANKGRNGGEIAIRVHPGKEILLNPHYKLHSSDLIVLNPENWLIPLMSEEDWIVFQTVLNNPSVGILREYGAAPTSGEIIFNLATRPFLTEDGTYDLILRGSHIQRYELAEIAKQGEPIYLKTKDYLAASRTDSKAYAHLYPRVVYQEGSGIDAWRRVIPTYLPASYICGHKVCYFTDYKIDMFTFLAIFGSKLINWMVERLSVTNSLPAYLVGNLPFPKFEFVLEYVDRERLLTTLKSAYNGSDYKTLDSIIYEEIIGKHLDVIHDLLAFLAQTMIDLNKAKQVEIKRFLLWLEGNARTVIDNLSGKSIIKSYLGDYQKGEGETPLEILYEQLAKPGNRKFIQANLSALRPKLEDEYEKSLATLIPIKNQLAATDRLIDQIVYQLYGLTDEEIAIVEGHSL